MVYYVYLIATKNKQKITSYVGYTSNIKNRVKLHNTSKGAKFTKGKKWQLIYSRKFSSKVSAMKYEYILKKNQKKRNEIKLRFIK